MKIILGPHKNWVGPYQLAEKILFWLDKYEDKRVHKFGDFLAHGFNRKQKNRSWRMRDDRPKTWLYKLCSWVDSKRKRKVKIHIDPWDSWNVDATLAPIILPLLKQLRDTTHGSGFVDFEDVPEHLRATNTEEYDDQKCFDFYNEAIVDGPDIHTRYKWVLDEMIWAFEQIQPGYDWEAQYSSGDHDIVWEPDTYKDDGSVLTYRMTRGKDDTYVCDYAAKAKHQERICNGLRLFGKYFQHLWS